MIQQFLDASLAWKIGMVVYALAALYVVIRMGIAVYKSNRG